MQINLINSENNDDIAGAVVAFDYHEENFSEKILDLLIKAGDLGFDWQVLMPWEQQGGCNER